ncbi:hypothetical protein ACPA9J_10460 [Pseudomonas aeruginosa]
MVDGGQSLDTQHGPDPLEGLSNRAPGGDVDPNLHSHLARTLGWSLERIDSMLNNEVGLLGLSDLSTTCTPWAGARAGPPARPWRSRCSATAWPILAAMSRALPQLDEGDLHRWHRRELAASARQDRRPPAAVRPAPRPGGQRPLRARVAGLIQAAGSVGIDNEERQIALDTLAPLDSNWIDAPAQPGGVAKRTA